MRRLIPFFLIMAAACAGAASFMDPLPAGEADGGFAALASRIASSLSGEDLLAQTFMLGYVGTDMTAEMAQWIGERRIGGAKIFTRNISGLPALAADVSWAQKKARSSGAGIPLFVATDQEGGWVRHVKGETSVSAGNLGLGASGLPRDAYLTGRYLGQELAALGITMNFAPTVDVYANPKASAIGPRSFGSDPVKAGLLAEAYVEGMRSAGIMCTAKHFPGHGSADADSHGSLPVITAAMETLRGRDLVPYRMLAKGRLAAVMSAHLAFPSILGDLTPSSLSRYFITDVLRGELGFTGIVITDDMEMEGALSGGIDVPTACLRALKAGNDMVLISHSPPLQEKAWALLVKEMKTDAGLRASIRASAERIIRTKLEYYRGADAPKTAALSSAETAGPSGPIPAAGAGDFFFQNACRSVSLISDKRIPLEGGAGGILLCGQYEQFIREGMRRYPAADALLLTEDAMGAIAAAAGKYGAIVFCLSDADDLRALRTLEKYAGKVLVISALSPVLLSEVPWVQTAVAVYGFGADSFRAGFAVLAGDFTPVSPVPLEFGAGAAQ